MLPVIKKALKTIFPSSFRRKIKKYKRHIVNSIHPASKLTLEEMKRLLTQELGLCKGDKIIVTSSFANLNASFSPAELMHLLMEIVTKDGLIVMPYYPPLNSTEWASKNYVFDMRNTKSGMGILTNVFAKMPDVYMSKHPTKAVCAWGKNAEIIVRGHDSSLTPYYWGSPYGNLLKNNSKSIGLGVTHIPIFHAIEDILSPSYDFFYQKKVYKLKIIDKSGECTIIDTLVHDDDVLNHCIHPREFVATLNCKTYKKVNVGYNVAYTINNDDLFTTCEDCFEKGYTRLKK